MTSKEKTGINLKTHYEKEGKTAERPLAKKLVRNPWERNGVDHTTLYNLYLLYLYYL